MTKGRDRRPSPGEARLWRRAMQGVDALPGRRAPAPEEEVPLAAEPAAPPAPPAAVPRPAAPPAAAPPAAVPRPAAPPAAAPPPNLPALGHGRMPGVDALPGRRAPAPEEEVPLAAEPAAPPAPPAAVPRPAAPPAAAPPPALPALGHGRMPGVDKRTAQRLKRGQLAIEARLDLHGCVRDEARRALGAFIAGARAAGQRCVLVITGKGTRPGGAAGVLRGAVPGWLNEADLRPQVLSFCYAAARHGGEGALYVLLRRKGRS